jgi:hypothetical protein
MISVDTIRAAVDRAEAEWGLPSDEAAALRTEFAMVDKCHLLFRWGAAVKALERLENDGVLQLTAVPPSDCFKVPICALLSQTRSLRIKSDTVLTSWLVQALRSNAQLETLLDVPPALLCVDNGAVLQNKPVLTRLTVRLPGTMMAHDLQAVMFGIKYMRGLRALCSLYLGNSAAEPVEQAIMDALDCHLGDEDLAECVCGTHRRLMPYNWPHVRGVLRMRALVQGGRTLRQTGLVGWLARDARMETVRPVARSLFWPPLSAP